MLRAGAHQRVVEALESRVLGRSVNMIEGKEFITDQKLSGSALETFNRIIEALQEEDDVDLSDPRVRMMLEELVLLLANKSRKQKGAHG